MESELIRKLNGLGMSPMRAGGATAELMDKVGWILAENPARLADVLAATDMDILRKIEFVHVSPDLKSDDTKNIDYPFKRMSTLMKPVTMKELARVFSGQAHTIQVAQVQRPLTASRPQRQGQLAGGLKVLVVEDNEFNRDIVVNLLADEGLEVETAENGQVAIDRIGQGKYDLVFMDFQMPVMDGITATKELRKTYSNEDLPIVALTAKSIDHDVNQVKAMGFDGYLLKPIDIDALMNTVEKFLSIRLPHNNQRTIEDDTKISLIDTIPYMDSARAMTRFNYDMDLFMKTFKGYIDRYNSLFTQVETLEQAGDYPALGRLVHSFAGITGNFALDDLFTVAKAVEYALKEGRTLKLT